MTRKTWTLLLAGLFALAAPGLAAAPFGHFGGIIGGANAGGGFLPLHGWALDDGGIARVEIWVDGQPAGTAYYGFARPDVQAMKALPAWAWLGGLYGCVFVVAAAWGVPKIGVALTITLMVAGQLALSLILDHFGVMGVPQQPISLTRIAGVLLVIGGVLLVRRG